MRKFEYFEVMYNGKIKSVDTLYDDAVEAIVDVLECLDTDAALDLGNEYRDRCGYDMLRYNDEENINEALEDESPYTILNAGWSDYDDYFTWDGYDLNMTDDVWNDIDLDDLAREILDGTRFYELPSEIKEILDEYNEVVEYVENYNPYRAEGETLLAKYTNCEADVTDLLQYIDRLVRNDEAWKEEE